MKILRLISMTLVVQGCVTSGAKTVLDSSPSKPSWVDDAKLVWEDDGKVFFKAMHSIKGAERLNGCYTLGQLDAKENLLSEIANEVKGSIDAAETSLDENAEVVLGKVRSAEFAGKVQGLRFSEQYFERYTVADTERIDCYVLGEIKQADYTKTKQSVINKVAAADPRIKEAITQKQIDFFSSNKSQPEPAH